MNQHMTVTTELQRQHEAHKAVRDRIWKAPAKTRASLPSKGTPPIFKAGKRYFDADHHVMAYRQWQEHLATIAQFSTAAEIVIAPDGIDRSAPKKRIGAIISEVLADYPNIKAADILGNKGGRAIVFPRQLCHYAVCMQRPDLSRAEIGRRMNRDHSTILHSVQKINALKATGRVEA